MKFIKQKRTLFYPTCFPSKIPKSKPGIAFVISSILTIKKKEASTHVDSALHR